jgi:chromosome segregation ATPase
LCHQNSLRNPLHCASLSPKLVCRLLFSKTTMANQPNDQLETQQALQQQLTENQAQCTEIIGQINQLTIQLHRAQLRLRTLETRQGEVRAQLAKFLPSPAA